MTNIPLISVIIPSYNSENFVKEAINSVLAQTYKNIEIILVDDGSTDGTDRYFNEFKEQGVKCFSINNGGASNARNFGLSKAKGEFIQFLDADDLIHKNKIEFQLNAMEKQNADISFTPWVNFSYSIDDAKEFRFKNNNYNIERTGKELLISYGMENWFIPVHSWLIRRKLIEKSGEWNVAISNNDDGEYFTRVLLLAKKVICIDKVFTYYRVLSEDSLSKLNSINKINSAFESYKLIANHIKKYNQKELLCYPKRLYYMQYKMIRYDFEEFSKRASIEFDKLKVGSFLSREKKKWFFIKTFGLYRGVILYNYFKKVGKKIKSKINF